MVLAQSKFTQNQNLLAVCVDSEIKKSLKVKRIEAAPDYHNALKETSFQIRTCMKSLCDIQGKPNEVVEIIAGKWINLELGEGLPFYGKVNMLMRKPPMVFDIKYDNPPSQTIIMYGSFDQSEPTMKNK